MSTFRVTSEELASAGGAVRRSVGDLAGAPAALRAAIELCAGSEAGDRLVSTWGRLNGS